tara:strand:- start:652 stop:1272 length:621 start_codon:yes stop_codon:yes gene_type:complete
MIPLFIEALTKRLKRDLPGKNAQRKMMITPNRFPTENQEYDGIPASVLLLLYPFDGVWFFFLTKRSQDVEHHKGQISFPGGVVEKSESKMDAAIRETNEEIGVDKNNIKIIGSLTPFYIPVSNFHISPYVGWTEEKPHTKVQDAEVKRVFSVSINDLVLEKNLKTKKDFFSNKSVKVPYFDLNGETVWGATSMILSEFKFILKDLK